MTLDDETRSILFEKLKLSKEEIDKYERGHLTLSKNHELIIKSAKLTRKISKRLSDNVPPLLDECNVFNANRHMFNIAHDIGEQYERNNLTPDDHMDLMKKLNEYDLAGRLICECKNKVPRTM